MQELRRAVRAPKHANQHANDPHIGKEAKALQRLLQRYRVCDADARRFSSFVIDRC